MFARSDGQINIIEYFLRVRGVLKTDMLKNNTDAHRPWEIGRAYVECPDFRGREDFLAALSAGTVTGRLAGHSIHLFTRYDKVRKWLGRRGTKRS